MGRLDKPAATVGGNLPTSLLTLSDKGGKTISALDAFWADAADKDYFGSLSGVFAPQSPDGLELMGREKGVIVGRVKEAMRAVVEEAA